MEVLRKVYGTVQTMANIMPNLPDASPVLSKYLDESVVCLVDQNANLTLKLGPCQSDQSDVNRV